MKRLLVFLAIMLLACNAWGGQVQKEIINSTLSKTNTSEEAEINIENSKRVSFFATIDNYRTTAQVTATVTVSMSLNGTDWTDISWFDVSGGATPQTSETTSLVKQTYVGWLDNRLQAKYIRIKINANDLKETAWHYMSLDTADISVTVVQDE